MKKQIIVEVIAFAVIILFLYTGFSKLFDPGLFKYDLFKQPIAGWLQPYLQWFIPLSEILVAATLIFERTRRAGLLLAFCIMAVFSIYSAAVLLHFFAFVPCGCGGLLRMLSWPQHLIFNLFFLVLITIGLILQHNRTDINSVRISE